MQGDFLPQFIRQPHFIKGNGVQSNLVFLHRHGSLGGIGKAGTGIVFVRIADFYLPPGQLLVFSNSNHNAFAKVPDSFMGGDLLHIRVRHDAGTQMAVISGLLKIHVPQVFNHALR